MLVALLAVALWAFCSHLGAVPLLDDPNEGEYAEVPREMLESGEWLSPQLNYVLFLNKPPLTYWLVGASYLAFGVNEFAARLPIALVAVLIVFLVVRLGSKLFDEETGLLAGLILLTSGGFFLEAHLLRPDLLQVAAMVGCFLALAHLLAGRRTPNRAHAMRPYLGAVGAHRRAPRSVDLAATPNRAALIGWQIALAAGLMSKGMLAILIPGCVCLVLALAQRDAWLLRTLLHPRAWWLLLLLMAPWHVLMSLRHEGFLWDYVINQHLLFFFDKKWPRDSEPVSLAIFWGAYAARLFPWMILAPLAVFTAAKRAATRIAWNEQLLLTWAGGVLLLFSAAVSRMEHYSIPALPPMALLIAKLLRDYQRTGVFRRTIAAHMVAAAGLMIAAVFIIPGLIAEQPWLAAVGDFVPMARTVFLILSTSMGAAALSALWPRGNGGRNYVAPAVGLGFLCIVPYFLEGLTLVAQINASAPLAAEVTARLTPQTRVVYEAPVEYQQCASFNFYLRRKLDLLAHPQFVPPPYLAAHVDDLFISRARLSRAWEEEPVLLITDPLQKRRSVDGPFPAPAHIISRDYTRLLVGNRLTARIP